MDMGVNIKILTWRNKIMTINKEKTISKALARILQCHFQAAVEPEFFPKRLQASALRKLFRLVAFTMQYKPEVTSPAYRNMALLEDVYRTLYMVPNFLKTLDHYIDQLGNRYTFPDDIEKTKESISRFAGILKRIGLDNESDEVSSIVTKSTDDKSTILNINRIQELFEGDSNPVQGMLSNLNSELNTAHKTLYFNY